MGLDHRLQLLAVIMRDLYMGILVAGRLFLAGINIHSLS